MGLGFWKAYGSQQVQKAHVALLSAIAQIDPAGFTAADIDDKFNKLLQLGQEIEAYRRKHQDAKKAFEAANDLNATRIGSLDYLQTEHDDPATSPERRASLEKSIISQTETVEKAQADLDELKEAEQDALATFNELDGAYQAKVEQVKNRKHELEHQQSELARAQRRVGRAQEKAQVAKVVAGLSTTGPDAVDPAINAMKAKTNALNDKAASLNRAAAAIAPAPNEQTDLNIAAAMAKASGAPASTASAADRIAALKARQATRAA